MAAGEAKITGVNDLQTISQTISKMWHKIYPPLPEIITERRKMLVVDFVCRLLIWWPMALLSIFGSRPQLMWLRCVFNSLHLFRGSATGEDQHMKTTVVDFDGVSVRVYEPKKLKGDTGIIFIHGGGFTFCSARTYDFVTRYISRRSGLVLASIDYRLAPEHKYPAAVQDCERAAVHFLTRAYKNYSVDPHKVVIMGDSAGGNLTAVTVQRLRRLNVPQPKLQVMIYPWTQMLDFKLPSYQMMERYTWTTMLSPGALARFSLHYLVGGDIEHFIPDLLQNKHTTPEMRHSPSFDHVRHDRLPKSYSFAGRSSYSADCCKPDSANLKLHSLMQSYLLDPDVCPLLHPSLEGSPKTMVVTVELDSLRDEGILYAERLKEAGVYVVHKHYQNGFHGMIGPATELGRQAIKDIITFIKENV